MVRRFHIALLAASFVGLCTGCVERRFRVESNPPGAYLFVNNQPIGPTPIDVPFLFYGDYEMRLVKDGFQTKVVKQPVPTPWYEYPIAEFFSENAWPFQITDIRPLYYELNPAIQPNLEELKAEAEELRNRGKALPAPRYPEPKKERPAGPPRPEATLPAPRGTPSFPAPKHDPPQ
jgi:PEGA domain